MKHQGYYVGAACLLGALLLSACDRQESQPKSQGAAARPNVAVQTADFTGCYSIQKDQPAQIWIHQKAGRLVMQMKESKQAAQTWDSAEVLEELTRQAGWKFFQVNHLNLSSTDLIGVAARPDGVLAIGQVKSAVANTNPYLDSPYVISLLGAVNTIYQVECDDQRLELNTGKGFHGAKADK